VLLVGCRCRHLSNTGRLRDLSTGSHCHQRAEGDILMEKKES
jgi:hypothetical protein